MPKNPPSHPKGPYQYPQGVMGRLQPYKVNVVLEAEATLGSLSDVTDTATDGQVLIKNTTSGKWEPATLAYQTVAIDGFATTTPRSTLRLIGTTNIDVTINDDVGGDETEITFALTGSIDADSLGAIAATYYPVKYNDETITGAWSFDKAITLDGATSGEKRVEFDAADLSFTRDMGFGFSHGGKVNDLHKTQVEITSGDFLWQTYNAGWATALEIQTASRVVDFKQTPTVNGVAVDVDGHTHLEADITDLGSYVSLTDSPLFTGGYIGLNSASPYMEFQDTADAAGEYVGPRWKNAAGTLKWSTRFDGTNLGIWHHNGSPAEVLGFDLAYARVEFKQRPTEDGYGAAALGVPVGEVLFSGDDLDSFADVTYSLAPTTGQTLLWNVGGYWEPADVPAAATLESIGDVTLTTIGTGELLQWNGSAWVNQTIAELDLPTLSGANTWTADQRLTSATPQTFYRFSGAPGGVQYSGPAWENSSAAIKWSWRFDDTDLYFYEHNGTPSISWQMDLAYGRMEFVQRPTSANWGAGGTPGTPSGYVVFSGDDPTAVWTELPALDAANTWTAAQLFQGATATFDGTQDIVITPGAVPKISSTGLLQIEVPTGSYLYYSVNGVTVSTIQADGLFTLGSSTTTDLKIHEASAGQWTVEAQSTNDLNLKGTEVWIDDGGTSKARAASVKDITASATTPTGDYPYGTLHLIY